MGAYWSNSDFGIREVEAALPDVRGPGASSSIGQSFKQLSADDESVHNFVECGGYCRFCTGNFA